MIPVQASHQGYLEKALQVAFPSHYIQANAREQVKNPETGNFLELDMWIPDLQLGIEFQDAHHYMNAWYAQDSLDAIQVRDTKKLALIRQHGIDLIRIPYWWNSLPDSLIATIQFEAPWIIDKPITADPVSLNPPLLGLQRAPFVPKVGELMLATFVEPISNVFINPAAKWWVGEKYDGIRCVWSPVEKILYSRNGIYLNLTSRHLAALASVRIYVDGEIWCGRGMYHETLVTVSPFQNPTWGNLRLLAFDNPVPSPDDECFEKRYLSVCSYISVHHPIAITAFRVACKGQKHLENILKEIIEKGGEGCMVQQVGSGYERGRSSHLLKVKSTQDDTEALVIGVNGNTRTLKMPSGRSFDVTVLPTSPINPKMGDIVTYEHDSAARRDVPVNPKILRIRKDLAWEDVLKEFVASKKSTSGTARVFAEKPRQFWKKRNSRNVRAYLESFAKKRGLDPKLPATWYSISRGDFNGTIGMSFLHGIGYVRLVRKLFPELSLDVSKFQHTEMYHWQEVKNRKNFFDRLARERGFDPLIAANWYSVTRKMVEESKGHPLAAYSGKTGKLASALIHLYPNIGLDKNKFRRHKGYWQTKENRKRFFDTFAANNSFDPLLPDNWYNVTGEQLERAGSLALLKYTKGGYVNELLDVYPNIGLDAYHFPLLPPNYWENASNRRRVLEAYAQKNNFDPRSPDPWYSVSAAKLGTEKHARSMLRYYQNKMVAALLDLYPDVGFTL